MKIEKIQVSKIKDLNLDEEINWSTNIKMSSSVK